MSRFCLPRDIYHGDVYKRQRLQKEEKIQDQRKRRERKRKAAMQKIQNLRGKLRYLLY